MLASFSKQIMHAALTNSGESSRTGATRGGVTGRSGANVLLGDDARTTRVGNGLRVARRDGAVWRCARVFEAVDVPAVAALPGMFWGPRCEEANVDRKTLELRGRVR